MEKFPDLVLIADVAMMFRLIADIRDHGVSLRFANGKTGIPALPSETVEPLGLQPVRGIALDDFNKLGDLQRARQLEEGMYVVSGTATVSAGQSASRKMPPR